MRRRRLPLGIDPILLSTGDFMLPVRILIDLDKFSKKTNLKQADKDNAKTLLDKLKIEEIRELVDGELIINTEV